jgi:N-acetylglucosamine kinase-like BadF-type ATPase
MERGFAFGAAVVLRDAVNWFLGIDGGGTRTRAVIVDAEGAVLGVGHAGSANYHAVGITQATQAVAEAVAAARTAAHVAGPAAGAFLGLAGVKTAADHLAFREPLASLRLVRTPEKLGLDHDLRIALAGGRGVEPGVVVVAGTGAAAYGRDRSGTAVQVGGWGWLLDDQGGGTWLGIRGLRALVEAEDGRGERTRLEPALFAELGVTSVREAMVWAMRPDTARFQLAALAPVVLQVAADGDPVAQALVAEGARQLGRAAKALVAALSFGEGPVPVVPAGGLLGNALYLGALRTSLAAAVPRAELVTDPAPPIAGAARLAAAQAGVTFGPEAVQRLADGLRRPPP